MSGMERRHRSAVLSLPRSPFLQVSGGTPPSGSTLLQEEMPPMPWDSRGWKGGHEEQEVLPCWMQRSWGYTSWKRTEQPQKTKNKQTKNKQTNKKSWRWWTEPTAMYLNYSFSAAPFYNANILWKNSAKKLLAFHPAETNPHEPTLLTPYIYPQPSFHAVVSAVCVLFHSKSAHHPNSPPACSCSVKCSARHLLDTPLSSLPTTYPSSLAWHSCKEKGFGGISHQTLPLWGARLMHGEVIA